MIRTILITCSLVAALPLQAQLVVDHNIGERLRGHRTTGQPPVITGTPVAPDVRSAPDTSAILKQITGSYSAHANGPTLLTSGLRFVSHFTIPPHVPANATITNVTWRYDLEHTAGVRVLLCQTYSHICFNVSKLHKGHTHLFNSRRASEPLSIIYEVMDGQPAQTQAAAQNQVIVSYSALVR